MIKIFYKKEDDIIYVIRTGKIYLNDIIDYIKKIYTDFSYKKALYVLDDTRDSFTMHNYKDDLLRISDEIKKVCCEYKIIKTALIVNNPSDTAKSIIFETMSGLIDNYMIKTFSTEQTAKDWLMLG